ncbi:MAG TPA: hypothetical protein VG244_00985 [Acidimicrobiales bacterium]|nr:hypothetical protein [Acidimicrobiales bacterium]
MQPERPGGCPAPQSPGCDRQRGGVDGPSLVAILGDEQYQVGTLADFKGSYDQTYGAFKFLQRPSPGNHGFYSTHGQDGEDGIGYSDSSGQVAVPNLQAAQGAGSAFQNGQTTTGYPGAFGVMKLTLGQNGYGWDYQSATAPTVNGGPAWGSFSDTGSAMCHGPAQGH